MPNWCNGNFTVSHEDPNMITKFVAAFSEGKLFETFIPFPNGEWEYGWCIENWGTKWDANCIDILKWDANCIDISEEADGFSAHGFMETAWGPPIAAFKALEELGFKIDCTYHEPGMAFAGHYHDGEDDCYEYDFSDPDWRDGIDNQDVVDMLDEEYAMYLETLDEPEEEE